MWCYLRLGDSSMLRERHMRANRTEYLFSVKTRTPPTMAVDSGEAFTVEVRGAFDDIEDISAVPTPFTPACDGHPLARMMGGQCRPAIRHRAASRNSGVSSRAGTDGLQITAPKTMRVTAAGMDCRPSRVL